ncbi:hypothetical protein S245_019517, partial [Arachis hypogaea]
PTPGPSHAWDITTLPRTRTVHARANNPTPNFWYFVQRVVPTLSHPCATSTSPWTRARN